MSRATLPCCEDVSEAVHAKTKLAKDQQRVALTYNGQSVGDRANSGSIGAQAGTEFDSDGSNRRSEQRVTMAGPSRGAGAQVD